MYGLIGCARIFIFRRGSNKLLFYSPKPPIIYSRSFGRDSYSYAFGAEKTLLKKDKLTQDYELIHRLPNRRRWLALTLFIYCLFVGTPVIISYLFLTRNKTPFKPVDVEKLLAQSTSNPFAMNLNESIVYGCLLITLNIALYVFILRYVLRIYSNGNQYVAIYMNPFFPLLTKAHSFKSARQTRTLLTFNLQHLAVRLGNKRARIFPEHFRRPSELSNLLECEYYEENDQDES